MTGQVRLSGLVDRAVAARVPSSSRGRYAFAGGRDGTDGGEGRDHRGSAAAGRANARACVIDLGRPEGYASAPSGSHAKSAAARLRRGSRPRRRRRR